MKAKRLRIDETEKYGLGVFANEKISAGEVVASFDGEFYEVKKASLLPECCRNHAIQCGAERYRDANSIARLINHSCSPNCGIKNLFQIVAMHDIQPGDEITWDYEMAENSNWTMHCCCGSEHCRTKIGAYRNLPPSKRKEYSGFISEWLFR